MRSQLLQLLRPIRRRLWLRHTYRSIFAGLTVGASLTLLASLTAWAAGIALSPVILVVCAIPTCITAVAGLNCLPQWEQAASAVDQRFNLKDRTLTALRLSQQESTSLAQLQMDDAVLRLEDIYPEDVVSFSAPSPLRRVCAVLLAIAVALQFVPHLSNPANAVMNAPAYVSEQTVLDLKQQLEQLQQTAVESQTPDVQQTLDQIQQAIDRLDPQQTTTREALAAVSQIQQQLQQLAGSLNVKAMDQKLKDAADALAVTDAFRDVAEAIQQDQLPRAADLLKQKQSPEVPPEQALAATEKLTDIAEQARQEALPDLADSLDELADAIAAGNTPQMRQQSMELAGQLESHQQLKSLQQSLNSRIDALNQAKKLALQSQSEGEGMAANATGTNTKKGESNRQSDSASRKAGGKSTGNPAGERTRLDAQRQMAQLRGRLTESGATDRETTIETESDETASRQAAEIYNQYQKLSEAVLETEAVPLGQKELIRRYFQQIRPQSAGKP